MRDSTLDVLQQVYGLLCRSFPRYLVYARPWTRDGQKTLVETLSQIAYDQEELAGRVNEAIDAAGAPPDSGEFPMDFTDSHDLAIAYIIQRAIEYQRQDIEALQECSSALRLAPAPRALADEALGLAKGHLELLESLLQPA